MTENKNGEKRNVRQEAAAKEQQSVLIKALFL